MENEKREKKEKEELEKKKKEEELIKLNEKIKIELIKKIYLKNQMIQILINLLLFLDVLMERKILKESFYKIILFKFYMILLKVLEEKFIQKKI